MKTLSAAVACALLTLSPAHAAGLGKLTVQSSLGQPLRAEVELTAVKPEELSSLSARLAPSEAFRQANIDFNPALLSVRFALDQNGGRPVLRLSSSQAMNEPFVDMLVQLDWTGGRLVREYTFLLDPAELRLTQKDQVAPAVEVPAVNLGRANPAQPAAVAAGPGRDRKGGKAPAAPRPEKQDGGDTGPSGMPAGPQAGVATHAVKPGETLGLIANQVRPAGVSLDQMLVALYRANADAFIGNNMNRLRSGQILKVPDVENVGSVTPGDAKGVVVAHAADFNGYRSKLAGQVAQSKPQPAAESEQSKGGKITTKVEEKPTAATESKDKLKLARADSLGAKDSKGSGNAAVEDKIAKDKIAAENAARVKELEKNLADMQKLVEIRNKNLADQEAKAKAAAALAAASVPAPSAVVPSASASASLPAPATVVASAPSKPKVKPAPPPPPPEPSLMDTLMDNLPLVGGLGLAMLGLGAFGVFAARRKKKKPEQFNSSILGESSMQANSLFGSTGGQSVDTNNSVFNSNFAPSASQIDTNEVDPVAEADVYIAYGRDAQAEEILKEALRTQPERTAVRLKLLEIYATRGDTRSFEVQAGELYAMTRGEGEDWAAAASLGKGIDPNNPLYADAEAPGEVVPVMHGATEPLDDLDPDAMMVSSQHPDPLDAVDPFDFDAPETQQPASDGLDLDLSQEVAAEATSEFDFNLDELPSEPAGQAEPEAPIVAAPPPQEPESEESMLDFDLGGLTFEPSKPQGAAPAPAPAPAPSLAKAAPPAAAPLEKAPQAEAEDPFNLDVSSIDFNLPDIGASAAPAAAAEPEGLPDIGSLDDFFAAPKIDGLAESDAEPAPPPALPDFDLSGIDLDLEPPKGATGGGADLGDLGDLDALDMGDELSAEHLEMDTKLDLALAYQEIGDREGARELIDEVIKGGTPAQIEKAKAMRLKVA